MNMKKEWKNGILTENPAAVRMVGLCTAAAVTTNLLNGLSMGVCMLLVLTLSNVILSALSRYLPEPVRTVSAVAMIAALSGAGDLIVQACFPELAGELGLFLPLLAVTCVLLSGAGKYAYDRPVMLATVRGLSQGTGYTLVLALTGILRELLGKGTFGNGLLCNGKGIQVFPSEYAAGGMIGTVGGFLGLACAIAIFQAVRERSLKAKGAVEK